MTGLITLSAAMAEAIRALGVSTPIRLIPPTVDDRLIQPLPEPSGPIRLLYSGNLGRKQGLEQLIDLAAELHRRGNHRAALQQQAAGLALRNLRFAPLYPAERLAEGLAEGHIHLVPQNPAGAAFAVPSKIYSIMAAGRPFICTAEPGSPLDQLRAEADAFAKHPRNTPWELFASEQDRLRQGLIHYRARHPNRRRGGHGELLERLHLIYQREDLDMAYTMEDFLNETYDLVLEEALKRRDPEVILKHYDPEAILKHYEPEERLKGLDPATIEAWLAKQRRDH